MSAAAHLAALHGYTRSDFAQDDADLRADRERAAAQAARTPGACRRPDVDGDLCTTCWTDHTDTDPITPVTPVTPATTPKD